MTTIYGALGISDSDRIFLNTLGQQVVYDAARRVLADYNADLVAARTLFVRGTTSDHAIRYKLPGSGRMQRVNRNSSGGAVKQSGQWDVAFPLEGFEDQLAVDRVSLAYMTTQDLAREIDTVQIRNTNTVRFEMLKALFNNTVRTFVDERVGSLSIKPLAGAADGTLYPPVEGSETEATEDHYLGANFLSSAISDTNNPFEIIVPEVVEHFGGRSSSGDNMITFMNEAQYAKVAALADFVEVSDRFVRDGANTAVPLALPTAPGSIVGRMKNRTWVSVWNHIPADYMVGVHLEAEPPLMKRSDLPETGLPSELDLVAQDNDHPFQSSFYAHRFGFGVANRLNGVVLHITNSTSYTIPTAFA